MLFNSDKGQRVLTLLLLVILLIPNLVVAVHGEELEGFYVKKMAYLAVSAVCLLIPALFLKKKFYFGTMGIFSLLLAPIEIASIYLSRTPTPFMMMDTIFNTNPQEAFELLSSFWPLVLLVVSVWVGYFFLTFKFVKNETFFPKKLRNIFLGVGASLLLIGCLYFFTLARKLQTSEATTITDNLIDMKDMMVLKIHKIFPFSVYFAADDVIQYRREVKERSERVKTFRFGIQPKEDDEEEVYVLVIGETARWGNFGLYGYERNTTPLLSQKKNLVAYDRFVTQANLTNNSIPLMLTRANVSNAEIADSERSVSEAFAEAGFRTSWITNQDVSPFQERIMRNCDDAVVQDNSFTGGYLWDMDLLTPLDSILTRCDGKKKFIVLHTQGSHFRYNQRYPAEFETFKPCIDNSMDHLAVNVSNKSLLVNTYDNTILYTDYFLAHVMDLLDERIGGSGRWAMVYLSDHGENIFDDEQELIVHGSLLVSDYEARVPFIVSYSERYRERYPEKVSQIVANREKNLNSEVLFHSLLDMADIRSSVLADSLSVCQEGIKSMESTYIMNGNREPVLFEFSRLDRMKR